MKQNILPADRQRFSLVTTNRVLVVIIMGLALLAGYFHAKASTLENRYTQTQTILVE